VKGRRFIAPLSTTGNPSSHPALLIRKRNEKLNVWKFVLSK